MNLDWKQGAIAGVLNAVYSSLFSSQQGAQIPLAGFIPGMSGTFLEGVLSNAIYQVALPYVAQQVVAEENRLGYSWIEEVESVPYISGLGTGAASQLVTTQVLGTDTSGSVLGDAVQGAVVNAMAFIGAAQL